MPAKTHRTATRVLAVTGCLLAVLAVAFTAYVSVYYPADDVALQVAQHSGVVETSGYYQCGNPEARIGYIFYPGAKVDAAAYLPYMAEVAATGEVQCFVVKPLFRLAILSPNGAERPLTDYPYVERWVVGGHSLGGVVAARYAAEHTERIEGLILLASYTNTNLAKADLPVLSITASEDGVLNRERYEAARANLPKGTEHLTIEGGNHSGFGSYGAQKGDGQAALPPEAQRQETSAATLVFLTMNQATHTNVK